MSFHIGQEVICVDGDGINLINGQVYVVEGPGAYDGNIVLVGVCLDRRLRGWSRRRFRPVRKTSIEIFTSMLTPTPTKENVEA